MRENGMLRTLMLVSVVALASTFVNAQDRPLETIRVAEFLKLPESIQAVYVAGILDGMSYVSYGNSDPNLGAWSNCVRKTNLEEMTKEVVAWLEANPSNRNYPVPWSVASALGARNCPH